jgi:hypothetical protein
VLSRIKNRWETVLLLREDYFEQLPVEKCKTTLADIDTPVLSRPVIEIT